MVSDDVLDEVERRAETLIDAAAIFDTLIETQKEMDVDESDEESAAEQLEGMKTAREMCKQMSVSMTIAMAQHGRVPDFDADTGETDDDISRTFH